MPNTDARVSIVTAEELSALVVPPPTGRWYPISHDLVLSEVLDVLDKAQLRPTNEQLLVTRSGARFFATLDFSQELTSQATLILGIRNSTDKSLPLAFSAGFRIVQSGISIFQCDLIEQRRHTLHSIGHIGSYIEEVIDRLNIFKLDACQQLEKMMHTSLTQQQAESLILRAMEKRIVTCFELPTILADWRTVSADLNKESCTTWALLNTLAKTCEPKQFSNPMRYIWLTMQLIEHVFPFERRN